MNEEWLSAHLDGELSAEEAQALEAALATDGELKAVYDDLARVRALLRSDAVDMPAGSLDRIIDAVEGADRVAAASPRTVAPVVDLRSRRRVPSIAAVAAAIVIIASVVGGVGPTSSLPALGDLISRHEVAAAVAAGMPMPDDMEEMGDEMPMDEAMGVAPMMPPDYAIRQAFVNGPTVHVMYTTGAGDPVSVFRHEGHADFDELGAGAVSHSDEAEMWSGRTSDAYVAVVEGTGYVWVVVSESSDDAMMDDMMHDLPTRSPSIGDRLRETADRAVAPFRPWDS